MARAYPLAMASRPWKPAAELHTALTTCADEALREKITGSLRILEDSLRVFGSDAVGLGVCQ